MINTTDRPIPIVHGPQLDTAIRNALEAADKLLSEVIDSTAIQLYKKEAFSRFLGSENILNAPLDDAFLQAAYDLSISGSNQNGVGIYVDVLAKYVHKRTAPATAIHTLKRGLKLALVELWSRRNIVLTTSFSPKSFFPLEHFDNPLLKWLRSFNPDESAASSGKTGARRLYYYGPRLIFATDWRVPADVQLRELSEIHRAQCLFEYGEHAHTMSAAMIPWTLFANQLLRDFPTELNFSAPDVVRYSQWSATVHVHKTPFSQFDPIERSRRKPSKPGKPRQSRLGSALAASGFASSDIADQPLSHDIALRILDLNSKFHTASTNWQSNAPIYFGREHVNLSSLTPIWIDCFRAWLFHRKNTQGFRSEQEILTSLNVLADYLFLYLPMWKELYPESKVALPSAPREFVRYVFVARHTAEPISAMPLTLLEVLRLRRSKIGSANRVIVRLALFFEFVGTHYADNEVVAGRGFKPPLNETFDKPREPRRGKTNKIVIPRNLYPLLLFYCYAVEAFGQHILTLAIEDKLSKTRNYLRSAPFFQCDKFGMTPQVQCRAVTSTLTIVPNVFHWCEREIVKDGKKRVVYVPHLTALRMLITSLETGLRVQSVQWLDRTTWDTLNSNSRPDDYTFRLYVNTDKTKESAWDSHIVFRVRQILQRETDFQGSFSDAATHVTVAYEGLSVTPFDPILPLFKSPVSDKPVSDNHYSRTWVDLMIGFEGHMKHALGEANLGLVRMQRHFNDDGTPVIRSEKARSFYPITWLATHTPHACRATFATNRQGILELSDVAALIGHSGEVVTSVYTKPSDEQIRERLERSDRHIIADYQLFESGADSSQVRADTPDSPLVRGFVDDREITIERFRFMPSIALWSTDDTKLSKYNGLNLLKTGPMSHIRFRETHICPVGEECPLDIVQQIGAPRRCGICPLAMKCIEHLPAIAAKKLLLLERIKFLHSKRSGMEKLAEPVAALDEVWDELQLDINELLGWKMSESLLNEMLEAANRDSCTAPQVLTGQPEVVRQHLIQVTRKSDATEFLLQRLAQSRAYPSMATPEVQAAAAALRRRLSTGNDTGETETYKDFQDDISAVVGVLATLMKAGRWSLADVAAHLMGPTKQSTNAVLLK